MSILTLEKFGAAFGDRIVLRSVDFEIPDKGLVTLLGPSGTGKSTLLRTICGINSAVSNFRTWGKAEYLGEPLGEGEFPLLVGQKAKLLMSSVMDNILHDLPEKHNLSRNQKRELASRLVTQAGLDYLADKLDTSVVELPLSVQRHLAIARTASASPKVLCVDEPTADLSEKESKPILDYLIQVSERCAVLLVLHNQIQAKRLKGYTALLAGGWIQESNTTENFFVRPEKEVTKGFLRSGSCPVPSANARPEELDESADMPTPPPVPQAASNYVSDSFGPRGFLWLKKGLLAGTPKPGIVTEKEYDLKALQRVGIKTLVSLTTEPVDKNDLKKFGIEGLWLKIKDMGTPTMEQAYDMCEQVNESINAGKAVAYHCKAGLGRTGTMLAAQLIMDGSTALEALESVRKIEPRWVQSDEQVNFIEQFADYVRQFDKDKQLVV